MNNEERILALLENQNVMIIELVTKVTAIETDVAEMKQDVDGLKKAVAVLDVDVAKLKGDVTRLSESVAIIEVQHGQSLGALHDGYKLLSDDIKIMKPIMENVAVNLSILVPTVTSHAKMFSALKAI